MTPQLQNIIAIYHQDCADGTMAAAVVLKKFPHARAYPLQHKYAPKDIQPILASVVPDSQIYTVDCALGVKEFLDAGYRVTTLDHHIGVKTTLENLAKSCDMFTYVFDNEKSGASLSWAYFFPEIPVPEVVALVEDFDLWKWQLGEKTKHVHHYLSMFLNKPEEVIGLLGGLPEKVAEHGAAITRFADTLVEHYATRMPIMLQIGESLVPAYNITEFQSECGNILATNQDRAVALFTINGGVVRFSFRSNDRDNPSALELAQLLGGGGHRNASGAEVTLKEFFRMGKPA